MVEKKNKLSSRQSLKRYLALAAAPLAMGIVASHAQDEGEDEGFSRFFSFSENSWGVDARLSYSDNFRRLPDTLTRYNIYGPEPTSSFTDDVAIDPLSNTMATLGFSGTSVTQRPGFTGIISGSIRFGTYLDSDSITDRLAGFSEANPPPTMPPADAPPSANPYPEIESTFGIRDLDSTFIDPNITASGTVRLAENLVYVDASAVVTEQALGNTSPLSQTGIGQSDEEIVFGGFSLSPYLFRKLANDGEVELRARATTVQVLDERIDNRTARFLEQATGEDLRYENDSDAMEFLGRYSSGSLLDRIGFEFGAFSRTVEESGSDFLEETKFTQSSASFDTEWSVNSTLKLVAGIGYDDIEFDNAGTPAEMAEDDAQADRLSGGYWKAGFELTPSNRSHFRATVGERYDGTSVEVDAKINPTPHLSIFASAIRQLDTGLQDFVGSAFNQQTRALESIRMLAESQTASSETILNRSLNFIGGYEDVQRGGFGANVFDRYSVGIAANFPRTNLRATYSQTEGDDKLDTGQGATTVSVSAQRQVSRRINLSASVRYTDNDGLNSLDRFSPNAATGFARTEQLVDIGASYRIGSSLSATVNGYHVVSDTDGSLSGTRFEYEENVVAVGLRWDF